MKLKNKKTGEIMDVYKSQILIHFDGGKNTRQFKSLDELNEEWEDYEEPKEYWVIDIRDGAGYKPYLEEPSEMDFEIGNYFSSKEEAELAVRKLKAWNRLKDKGFKFDSTPCCNNLCGNGFEIHFSAIMPPEFWNDNDTKKELTFLFGGEE